MPSTLPDAIKTVSRLLSLLACGLVRAYQVCISPLLPPSCRYYPSCSHYALQSLRTYGFLKGSLLALWRILRCNPFGGSGYDPLKKQK